MGVRGGARRAVLLLSRNRYPSHHILWYTEYKTTDKYMDGDKNERKCCVERT